MSPILARPTFAAAAALVLLACVGDPVGDPTDDGTRPATDAGDAVPDGAGTDDVARPDADATDDVPPDGSGGFPAELAQELGMLVGSAPREVGAPGVTVYVSAPSLGDWAGAAGLASVESGEPTRVDDRFRIGSITKTFGAALAFLLVQEGVIGLRDPVDDWVDGLALGADITIETLLNHTSGIFDYTDAPTFLSAAAEAAAPADVVAFAESNGRVHEPGVAWSYTNTGYFLLAMVVESATGRSFGEELHDRLLGPLALGDTFLQPDDADAAFVAGHQLGTEATDQVHMSWAWASGGMISTGADLCRWASLLFGGEVLTGPATDAMIERTRLPDGTRVDYGYGVQHAERGAADVIGHTGSTAGFRSDLQYEPNTGTCIAILTNDFFAQPRDFADAVWELVLTAQ